jgi:hypothetical protein
MGNAEQEVPVNKIYHYGLFVRYNPNVLQFALEETPEQVTKAVEIAMKNEHNILRLTDAISGTQWIVKGGEIQVVVHQPEEAQNQE